MAPPSETIFALVLSLSKPEELASRNEHFISALRSKIRTVRAFDAQKALQYLAHENLECVVVADEGINDDRNSAVLFSLMGWVNAGGMAVIGCLFPSSISGHEFDQFFEKWGVPWKMGNHNRTTFVLNRWNRQLRHLENLTPSYSMEALCLKGVKDEDVLYAPPEDRDKDKYKYEDDWEGDADKDKDKDSSVQSHQLPPLADLPHVAVACTRIGRGILGYVGDVNAEEETTSVMLVMLGRWF
jgi:hypothetical protein